MALGVEFRHRRHSVALTVEDFCCFLGLPGRVTGVGWIVDTSASSVMEGRAMNHSVAIGAQRNYVLGLRSNRLAG